MSAVRTTETHYAGIITRTDSPPHSPAKSESNAVAGFVRGFASQVSVGSGRSWEGLPAGPLHSVADWGMSQTGTASMVAVLKKKRPVYKGRLEGRLTRATRITLEVRGVLTPPPVRLHAAALCHRPCTTRLCSLIRTPKLSVRASLARMEPSTLSRCGGCSLLQP